MYPPQEDSSLIKKHIKSFCSENSKVLDMGTGSGILAFEASRHARQVTACDIDNKSITLLKKGIKKAKKIQPSAVRIIPIVSNLFENIKNKFDLIIFNPPYLPSKPIKDISVRTFRDCKGAHTMSRFVTENNKIIENTYRDIDLDGGKNGTEVIERFLRQAKKYLNKDGKILLLTSSLNKNIEKLFKKYKYKYKQLDEEKFFFERLYVWMLD
jgi:release factor glutamine methyltransferase